VSTRDPRRWTYVITATLLLVAASGELLAQTLPPQTFAPTVPTGKKRLVGFFTSLNPDCSAIGEIDSRVIKQPENGTVEIEAGTGFTNYPQTNQRYACNLKPSQGLRILYASKEGFLGKDTFDMEFLGGLGGDIVWKYSVTVK
jgi:hypothetical protein